MTQTTGKAQTPGTDVMAHKPLASRKTSILKSLRVTGAAVISASMVGVFALPAYANFEPISNEPEIVYSQALTTGSAAELAIPAHTPTAAQQPLPEPEVTVEEAAAASPALPDLPAGSGANGAVQAALAQLGVGQDCTDLVQNSLSAIGIVTSRLKGGPDLGVGGFDQFGKVYSFSEGNLAPGDILVWPGYHVALYVGNGQAVHGGWTNGGRHAESTVLTGATAAGAPSYVVRIG